MCTCDDNFSEWFGVEQDLCQGCAIVLLLLYILFTAVLHVAQAKFCDSNILRGLVRVRKCEKGPATKECDVAWQKQEDVRTPLGMLHAGGVVVNLRTTLNVDKIMAIPVMVSR